MDTKSIENQIKKNLIRQGPLRKRSKFLKQWRDRWVVLTSSFLFTFTNNKYQEMTDLFEIKDFQSIKSYLLKDEDMPPTGFKVESSQNVLHFTAKNVAEKWSWIVLLERLADFKFSKSSECKSLQDVKNAGFDSLSTYEQKKQEKNKNQPKEKEQEEPEKVENEQSNNSQIFQQTEKLINLLKAQEAELQIERKQLASIIEKLKQKYNEDEDVKSVSEKVTELNIKNDFQQLQGAIKGLIIGKKMEKEKKQSVKKMINLLIEGCENQRVLNWSGQLKEVI